MKVAMFEGLKRARKLRGGACRKGTHATCVKNRKKQGALTAQQIAFRKASALCKWPSGKGTFKAKVKARGKCIKRHLPSLRKAASVKRFKR